MDLSLHGKRVLVTGGSKGIGLACGEAFLREGAHVTLVSRNAAHLATAAETLAAFGAVATVTADLSVPAERDRLAAAHGDTDILINNAGAIPGGGLLDLTMERWREAWDLKVFGYIHLTQLMVNQMKARRSGVIVNVIGMAGRAPRYDYICGGTGNAALIAFTSALGGKASEWGVRVLGINPALTRTDRVLSLSKARAKSTLGDESRWQEMVKGLPYDRLIEPGEIGRTAAFLASPACGYVGGTVVDVDGGGMFRGA
jgi:3-oxoacyl-[acyl-carrier protein] reductase